jgi:hypothetical protein
MVIVFILGIFFVTELFAQSGNVGEPVLPLQPYKSILFGNDNYLNYQPLENQRNVVICSAYNGWLYAAYSCFDQSTLDPSITILRSKDSGVTWSFLLGGPFFWPHAAITKMDILACGHDTANLKVFLAYCIYDSVSILNSAYLTRYDGISGVFEAQLLKEFPIPSNDIKDIAIASDNLYPAAGSNPFSIAVVYSKWNVKDSIVFRASNNGGISLNTRYNIASTSHYFDKVALAYGRSPSCSTGRYFAAWEEQDHANSVSGHIYTAHSEPNFNSPFTTPVLLDSLDPSTANKASRPVIACQNNNADNDSANLTEIILFQKHQPASGNFNIAGVYNKKATNSSNFETFSINPTSNNLLQPDITFNPFDSTFIVTCFDSTDQKLPYYLHEYNMTDPDTWDILSAGYNDANNLVAPHPQVALDFFKQSGANVWIGEEGGGNGAAMFDSPYTWYVGDSEKSNDNNKLRVKIFPNPATAFATLEFNLTKTAAVNINLINPMGQSDAIITNVSLTSGKHSFNIDLSKYSSGIYIVTLQDGANFFSGKILKPLRH